MSDKDGPTFKDVALGWGLPFAVGMTLWELVDRAGRGGVVWPSVLLDFVVFLGAGIVGGYVWHRLMRKFFGLNG